MTKENIPLGILCGIAAGALWGLVFLLPEVVRGFGPMELTIGRYLAYGTIAAFLIGPRWHSLFAKLGRKEWIALFWLAFTGNTLYFLFLTKAVHWGGIAMTSLIVGMVPVAVTIVGSRQSGAVSLRRLMPSILFCIASALAIGADAFTDLLNAKSALPFLGLLAAIGSLVSWTIFALMNSQYLARLQEISAHDWSLLIGLTAGVQGLMMLPIALATVSLDHSSAEWGHFALACVGIALLASIGGNGFWNQANRYLPLTLVGQMVLFETIFALLYAFWWEGRGPTIAEMVAFACIIASTLLCLAAHRRPATKGIAVDAA